jgi:hypothetical protein
MIALMGAVADAGVRVTLATGAVARDRMNCYYSDDFSFITL